MSRNTALFSRQRSKSKGKQNREKREKAQETEVAIFSPSQKTTTPATQWFLEVTDPSSSSRERMRERKSKRKKKGSRSRWGEKNRKREKRAREGKKKKNTKLLSRGRQQNTLEVEDDGSARNTSFPTTIPSWNWKHTGIEQQILEFSCEFLNSRKFQSIKF